MAHFRIPVPSPDALLRRALRAPRAPGGPLRPGLAARWKPANRLALRAVAAAAARRPAAP